MILVLKIHQTLFHDEICENWWMENALGNGNTRSGGTQLHPNMYSSILFYIKLAGCMPVWIQKQNLSSKVLIIPYQCGDS